MAGRQWIYRHVHADRRAGGRLWRNLRRRGKRPNRRGGAHAGHGHIPGRVDISERPALERCVRESAGPRRCRGYSLHAPVADIPDGFRAAVRLREPDRRGSRTAVSRRT